MQAVTIVGLALCLGVLYERARKARNQPPSSTKQRLKTAHVLFAALVAWLLISFEVKHMDRALSGEAKAPQSTFERVVRAVSDWGI